MPPFGGERKEAENISNYTLRLSEDESVVISGPTARRLIASGDGDAALLYIAVLKNKGSMDDEKARAELKWSPDRFQRALNSLSAQGLVSLPGREGLSSPSQPQPAPPRRAEDQRPEYTRADMARALEGQEFAGLTSAVEQKLGKKLTTPDLAILLGLYDQLGLPSDVIYLLVSFCGERIVQRYGKGRQPTLRQIEKEGYVWARLGLMTQESAAAYIRKYHQSQEALPRMMRLLGLEGRKPSPGEEKYLLAWVGMGFEDKAIERAYDKTVLKCKELKWPYMNKILCSWHEKGLHTLDQVEAGDKPAQQPARTRKPDPGATQDDIARMEKYRQQLRREREET